MDDVAKIYDENIDGYLLAACHDADTAGLYNGYRKDKKEYTDKILKLKEPYQYFQAGVLLLNLEEFRKRYTTKQILDFAVSEKWQLLDQDILNKLCEGAVKYIDMSWNVMVDFAGIRINQIIALAPRCTKKPEKIRRSFTTQARKSHGLNRKWILGFSSGSVREGRHIMRLCWDG